MKKKIIPVLIVILLIALVIGGMAIAHLIDKYTPSKTEADLNDYFGVTEEDKAAVFLNNEKTEQQAKIIDGAVYLDIAYVKEAFNDRFYWDANENILLYTTAEDLISAESGATNYLVGRSATDYGRQVVVASADSAWVDLEFVQQYTDLLFTYYENPGRVFLTTEYGGIQLATITKDTQARVKGGIKSDIVANLTKGDMVTVLEEGDTWTKILTQDGIPGYVKNKRLKDAETLEVTNDFTPETYSHITEDKEICLLWHQVFSQAANDGVSDVLTNTKGVNVLSPTWFYLEDQEGNVGSIASQDYVDYCHNNGVEVWALFSNLVTEGLDTAEVLNHTSTRQNMVNQLISYAIQYNLDGINIDLEELSPTDTNDSFIQFIRELSLKCENNDIILSVDNYVPSDYTAFYDRAEQANYADYVIIMGYDEHYSGSQDAGSVASISWTSQGVTDTLKEVPADQIILGMPFYTRLWALTPDNSDSDTEVTYSVDSQALDMETAEETLVNHNAEKTWDEEAGQFYATYESRGIVYQIWLEDSSSMEERLSLMEDNSLAGAAFWKYGLEKASIWDTVIKYIN